LDDEAIPAIKETVLRRVNSDDFSIANLPDTDLSVEDGVIETVASAAEDRT
jgi:hypothetical protein